MNNSQMQPEILIQNLLYGYADLIDNGDFDGLGKLFSQAEFCSAGNSIRGSQAITDLYRNTTRLYPCGTPKTQHVVTNIQFLTLEAGSASTKSRFMVNQATDKLPLQTIITGTYLDEFRLTESGWHFSKREIIPKQIGDLSHHLLFDLDPQT